VENLSGSLISRSPSRKRGNSRRIRARSPYVVCKASAGGSPPDLASLADRLEQSQQQLLAEVVFAKEARPVSIEEINTYILVLERKRLERQRLSLQRKIQEAQKSQDSQLAVQLLRAQSELDKQLRNLL